MFNGRWANVERMIRLANSGANVSAPQELGNDNLGIPPVASRTSAYGADVSLGVNEADAAGVLKDIIATLAIEPTPYVVQSFDQLPRSIQDQAKEQDDNAEQNTKGLYHDGTL